MDINLVTDPDACMMYIVSPIAGLWGILWRPPAYSLFFSCRRSNISYVSCNIPGDIYAMTFYFTP